MPAATQLLAFGLRQGIDVPPDVVENLTSAAADLAASAGTAGKVFDIIRQRLTDHGETLPKALTAANNRAWQAVAVALAGRGFFTSVKEFFTERTPRALHEQVEAFLAQNADGFPGTSQEFRRSCLLELRQAEKAGLLAAGHPDPDNWARRAAAFRGLADPQGRIAEAHQAAAAVADALPRDYPHLTRLLKEATPPGQAPLLVAAFSFFFRRQVETNPELHRGLSFEGLRQLSARQEAGFEALGQGLADVNAQLADHGQHFVDVLDHLGLIEDKLDAISAQIAELASRNHVHAGPPRPQFVITINNEREQALARRLLAEVRKLPSEWQQSDDLSLLGDILRAAGLYPEATESYAGAAAQTDDRAERAANHYKMYLTALEQRRWDEGLTALTAAADLDAPHYAPFPWRHQYEPRRILGAGGFGTAFLCRHRYLNREVVIKSLFHADLEQGLDKVFAEAQTLLLLSREHPSIIGVQDGNFADDTKTHPYIVMVYFPGVSLQAHLEQLGPKVVLPLEDFFPIARQIAEAMRAAHGKNVLHRDLKPDNVLVRKEDGRWEVKVIDFGLAVRTRTVQVSTSRPAQERTLYGDGAAGTAKYASPEQMGEMPGIKPGTYSDVYTFGKLCCYALFRDTEPKRRQWASLPPELADMLERCVEKDLEHRHRNFEPVLAVLEALGLVEAERRRQEEESHRQAEAERQRQEQARQAEARRRQDEERRQAEEGLQREREEAELRRRRVEEEQRQGVIVKCPKCRAELNLKDNVLGKVIKCPQCATALKARATAGQPELFVLESHYEASGTARQRDQKKQPREPRPGEVVNNSLGMKFAWIPPGTFLMGSPKTEEGREGYTGADETQHRVTLTKGFHLGVHQVTQAQWQAVMGSNPSNFKGNDHPVENVSWDDCQEFCKKLAAREGKRYRLPTEAEWEYACRAGTTTPFHFGDTISTDQANYDGNYTYGGGKKGVYRQKTTPVASFPPNAWGLYDMHGNVWEWCQDWFGPYPKGDIIDYIGSKESEYRVLRGGARHDLPVPYRAAARCWLAPAYRRVGYGCRVVFLLD